MVPGELGGLAWSGLDPGGSAVGAASPHVQSLQEGINNLLNVREQGEFVEVINDYQGRRDVRTLAHCLAVILDTPAKRQLVGLLRRVVPPPDLSAFDDQVAQVGLLGLPQHQQTQTRMLDVGAPRSLPPGSRRHNPHDGTVAARAGSQHSAASLPVRLHHHHARTIRGAKVVRKPVSSAELREVAGLGGAANGAHALVGPAKSGAAAGFIKKVYMVQAPNTPGGLGFSIRGGAEHGIGVYVSYVDVDSLAERQGLAPGDQLLTVNGISFRKITHDEAAQVIKSCRTLDMEVRHAGRVPGSFETHEKFTWVDPAGRTVSPPIESERAPRDDADVGRRSGLALLRSGDERKVHLAVRDGAGLGLLVRGGSQFGLGIYITGVDRGSAADLAGLKVGDQIIDVNGTSFEWISHSAAVRVLQAARHLILTLRDAGKLPHARTTYDHTQWVSGAAPARPPAPTDTAAPPHRARHFSRHSSRTLTGAVGLVDHTDGAADQYPSSYSSDSMFSRGAGSQLVHNSLTSKSSQLAAIDDAARQVLGQQERATLTYYLQEYQQGGVRLDGLLGALMQLLDTNEKLSLVAEIRSVVSPRDIEKFDRMMVQREAGLPRKWRSMDALAPASDVSSLSHYSGTSHSPPQDNLRTEKQSLLVRGRTIQDPDLSDASDASNTSVVVAEVHPPPHPRKHMLYEDMRSPSEDSGVELNGVNGINGSGHDVPAQYNPHQSMYSHNWRSLSQSSRVTMSTKEPVIINEVLTEWPAADREGSHTAPTPRPTHTAPTPRPTHTAPTPQPTHTAPTPHPTHAWLPSDSDPTDIPTSTHSLSAAVSERSTIPSDMYLTLPGQLEYVHDNVQPESQLTSRPPPHPHILPHQTIPPNPSHYHRHSPQDASSSPSVPSPQNHHTHHNLSQRPKKGHSSKIKNSKHKVEKRQALLKSQTKSLDRDDHISQTEQKQLRTESSAAVRPHPLYPENGTSAATPSDRHWKHNKHRSIGVEDRLRADIDDPRSHHRLEPYSHGAGDVSDDAGYNSRHSDPNSVSLPSDNISPGSSGVNSETSLSLNLPRDPDESWKRRQLSNPSPCPPPPPGFRDPSPNTSGTSQYTNGPHQHTESRLESHSSSPTEPLTVHIDNDNHKSEGFVPISDIGLSHPKLNGDGVDMRGRVRVITLHKTRPNLGVAIEGGAQTRLPLPRISSIQPGGAASQCRHLAVGQVLLEVNGKSLEGATHKQCARIIAEGFRARGALSMELVVVDHNNDAYSDIVEDQRISSGQKQSRKLAL